MYQQTDKYLVKLKNKIRIEFNRLSVMGFDELNILNTQKIVNRIYKNLMQFNEKEYKTIAGAGYREGVQEFNKSSINTKLSSKVQSDLIDTLVIVQEVFRQYNPVTGYVYTSEADRKRARQIEQMLADRELSDRVAYEKHIRHAADLWYTQSSQYGQDIEDYAYTKALKDAGVHHVRWVTEHDEKTCEKCKSMDGNIYPINRIPRKQHYKCRCYWVPVD